MGKPLVKLMQGGRVLDLNDQVHYWLSQDFTPPETIITPLFAGDAGDKFDEIESNRQFIFTIAVTGDSSGAIDSAQRAVKSMLKLAGRKGSPLYLVYMASDTVPAPLWGQFGAMRRYEIAHGDAALSDGYMVGVRRETDINIQITLTIKPYTTGNQQRACTATGGIVDDTIGSVDGRSRGVIIGEATTNKFTNPVFGHGTWNNGWTAQSSLSATLNTDPQFNIIPGKSSVRLMASVAPGNATFYQSLNAGNTNAHVLSFYALKPDRSAISASDIRPRYDATGYTTGTYTHIGNGVYRVSQAITGINAAVVVGAIVQTAGITIYVDGFQLEELDHMTPLAWGDLTGCAWTGTLHASTSTRTVSTCKISTATDTLMIGAWSIRAVIKTHYSSTYGYDWYVFDNHDGTYGDGPYLIYDSANDKFKLVYSGQSVSSAALTFSAGAVYVIHAVCTGTTVILYVNGVATAASTAFAPATLGTNLFIGSGYDATSHGNQTTIGFATYQTALTAAQVLADYTNVTGALSNNERIETVPYWWTLGGDGVLSLDTGKQPLGVVGGVPGSVPAVTEIHGALSSNWSTIISIGLGIYACDQKLPLGAFLYDQSGTAAAGDYGGEHKTTTVNTSTVVLTQSNSALSGYVAGQLDGMEYYMITRLLGSAATSFYIYSAWSNSGVIFESADRLITPATGYRLKVTAINRIQTDVEDFTGIASSQIIHTMGANKNGTNVDISVDYVMIFPRPTIFIRGGNEAKTGFVYKGKAAYQVASGVIGYPLTIFGDPNRFEFEPGKVNHVLACLGIEEAIDPVTTYSVTISAIYLTPRWALL